MVLLKIDGNVLEGGGQILRISLSTSAITGRAIRVDNIRAGRKKGGLAAQHLKGLELVQQMSKANVTGAFMGSSAIEFYPNKLCCGQFCADTLTAGSVALLLQVAFPCCLFSNGVTNLTLKGGTNAEMAPQIDYTINVFKPMLEKFGIRFECDIKRRGFFPAGKGEVQCIIPPVVKLNPIQLLEFGEVESITGEAFVAGNLPIKLADEMAISAQNILRPYCQKSVLIRVVQLSPNEAFGKGWGINIVAKTTTGCHLGASQLGRPGLRGEQVGRLAAEELAESLESRVCVDQHLQDQLPIFMAFAAGTSSIRTTPITLHTQTAIHIINLITGVQFNVKKERKACIIECTGNGLLNKFNI